MEKYFIASKDTAKIIQASDKAEACIKLKKIVGIESTTWNVQEVPLTEIQKNHNKYMNTYGLDENNWRNGLKILTNFETPRADAQIEWASKIIAIKKFLKMI